MKDAAGVRDVLLERYGFRREHIIELLDEQATATKIQSVLYKIGQQASKDDSVFIYYAGHGQYEEEGRLGWWVPVEARPDDPGTFIMDVSVVKYVKGMKAKDKDDKDVELKDLKKDDKLTITTKDGKVTKIEKK